MTLKHQTLTPLRYHGSMCFGHTQEHTCARVPATKTPDQTLTPLRYHGSMCFGHTQEHTCARVPATKSVAPCACTFQAFRFQPGVRALEGVAWHGALEGMAWHGALEPFLNAFLTTIATLCQHTAPVQYRGVGACGVVVAAEVALNWLHYLGTSVTAAVAAVVLKGSLTDWGALAMGVWCR